jgi:hypothetical protein
MIGFIVTSLQLQSGMTAHNQWLSTTRSIPYWTKSVFSSTATTDERRTTAHTLNSLERRSRFTNELSFITSRRPEYKAPCRTVPLLFCPLSRESVFSDLLRSNDSFVAIRCSRNVITEPMLSNGRPFWLHYSGFQTVFAEALSSNGHISSQYCFFNVL